MSSKPMVVAKTEEKVERFPEFPPRDDMQNPIYLHTPSTLGVLKHYLGNPDTTLVLGEVPVGPNIHDHSDIRIPDLIVSRNCNVSLVMEQRGYGIAQHGKAPDFVLEVASETTGVRDYTVKREDYERYGILEYWRFDPTGGRYHDAALAGDGLVNGGYEPIEVERLDESRRRGYSEVLGLYVCWEEGELRWYDPDAGMYLRTLEEEVALRVAAEDGRRREAALREAVEAENRRLRERLRALGDVE